MTSQFSNQTFEALQARIAELEQETQSLRQELGICQQLRTADVQVVEPKRAYALLQSEVRGRCCSDQELRERLELAREQERAAQERAAELVKANEALHESLRKLADEPDLNKFLGYVLTVSAQQFGAVGSAIWQLEENTAYLIASYEDGKVYLPEESSPPVAARAIIRHNLEQNTQEIWLRLSKGEIYTQYEEDFQRLPEFQSFIKQLQHQGIKAIHIIPMFFGDSLGGCLTLRVDHRRMLTTEEAELAYALANQAMLALELTRLAEAAKQAAVAKLNEVIAREQERSALEQAAEFARANAALRHSIDALTAQPSLEAFLSAMLQAIAEVLKVPSACLWKFEGEWSRLQWVYQDGLLIPAKESDHPNANQPVLISKDSTALTFRERHSYPYFFSIHDPNWDWESRDVYIEMFQKLGVRGLLNIPIIVGERVVGCITARFTHEIPDPSPACLELVNTLANQPALALRMAELAEAAKQAAVAREREEAAQERAAELAKANALLQESLGKLADEPELDKFLGHVLTVSSERFGAVGSAIWQLEENTAYLIASHYKEDSNKDHKVCLFNESPYPSLAPVIGKKNMIQKTGCD
jgi:GAF domain-containing protein